MKSACFWLAVYSRGNGTAASAIQCIWKRADLAENESFKRCTALGWSQTDTIDCAKVRSYYFVLQVLHPNAKGDDFQIVCHYSASVRSEDKLVPSMNPGLHHCKSCSYQKTNGVSYKDRNLGSADLIVIPVNRA